MSTYRYHEPEEPPVASVKYSKVAQSLAEELENPAIPGERHSQIKRTIMPLIEVGLSDPAIFAQYRGMYDAADFSDSEINALIKWGRAKVRKTGTSHTQSAKKRELTPEQKVENAIKWLGNFRIAPADLWEQSQIRAQEDSEAILYLSLFQAADFVNFNARYLVRKLKDGTEKAELCGPGETKLASEWIQYIQANGIPEGRAGVWVRINPLQARYGNSPSGAHTDADVAHYDQIGRAHV